jgi:Major Facilitator Superfamily
MRLAVADTARLMCTRDSLLLSPMYLFSGLESAFWSGEFSQMLAPAVIGLVLTFAGVGEVLGGVLFGRLSDRFGRTASISIASACYAGGLAIACYMRQQGWMPAPVVAGAPLCSYVAALLFGLGDAGFNANCYALVSQIYQREDASRRAGGAAGAAGGARGEGADALLLAAGEPSSSDEEGGEGEGEGDGDGDGDEEAQPNTGLWSVGAFTVFMMLQNLGSGVGFFYALPFPMHDPPPGSGAAAVPGLGFAAGASGSYIQAYVQFVLLAVSLAGFIVVDRKHAALAAAAKAARAARSGKRSTELR